MAIAPLPKSNTRMHARAWKSWCRDEPEFAERSRPPAAVRIPDYGCGGAGGCGRAGAAAGRPGPHAVDIFFGYPWRGGGVSCAGAVGLSHGAMGATAQRSCAAGQLTYGG